MIPTWAIILDYIMGAIMWTLIGRAAMNIFQREDSDFFFMKVFVKYTDPIIRLFKFITPSFLFGIFIPLYVAWFFYLFRFYVMPYVLGYDVWGMLSFPLESDLSKQLYQFFKVLHFHAYLCLLHIVNKCIFRSRLEKSISYKPTK